MDKRSLLPPRMARVRHLNYSQKYWDACLELKDPTRRFRGRFGYEARNVIDAISLHHRYARFRKYLPRGDDLTLITLKGHLLIEEHLYDLASHYVERPYCLKEAKLSFAQLRWIAEGLTYDPADRWVWQATSKLNTIRNKLAHRLEPPDFHSRLQELFGIMETGCPIDGFYTSGKNKSEAERLRRTIADIILYLIAMQPEEE